MLKYIRYLMQILMRIRGGTSIVTPTINFINTSQGAVSYLWNFGDYASPTNTSTAVNPSHEYMYSGSYTVTLIARSEYGCLDYVAKSIYIEPEFHLYIPNVFTPDGNGLNDVFQPKGIGIDESDYKMLIYDRWGELIYESNNFSKGWDGSVKGNVRKATQDVYVYKIYVRDLKGNRHEFVGHVTCLPHTTEKLRKVSKHLLNLVYFLSEGFDFGIVFCLNLR